MRERGDRSLSMLERELAELRSEVDSMRQRLAAMPVRVAPPTTMPWYSVRWGWVVQSELVSNQFSDRWKYTWQEIELFVIDDQGTTIEERLDFQPKDDIHPEPLYNMLEWNNFDRGGMRGIGVTKQYIEDPECPFTLQPIPRFFPIPVWTVPKPRGEEGRFVYVTYYSNAVKSDE